jgi:hypothetical protein
MKSLTALEMTLITKTQESYSPEKLALYLSQSAGVKAVGLDMNFSEIQWKFIVKRFMTEEERADSWMVLLEEKEMHVDSDKKLLRKQAVSDTRLKQRIEKIVYKVEQDLAK